MRTEKKPFDFNKAIGSLLAQNKAKLEEAKEASLESKAMLVDDLLNQANEAPKANEAAERIAKLPDSKPAVLLNNLSIIESARSGSLASAPTSAPERAEPRGLQGNGLNKPIAYQANNAASATASINVTAPTATQPEPAQPSSATNNSSATFQWDESQLQAIDSIMASRFSCLIGAAGSGKTTVVKEIVSRLEAEGIIKPLSYSRCNGQARNTFNVSFVSFTGKAVEQLRKSIPPHLQCCCETIHSLLEYAPVVIDKIIDGKVKTSRIFRPRRDQFTKLPQSVVIIDESGMVGIDLWNNLFKALDLSNPSLKIILIGDINQLPAVIGKSVLGYALNSSRWTTATLTHIHRQALDNPIIANAHAIKDGREPRASEPCGNHLRKFNLINIGSLTPAEREGVRLGKLNRNLYDIKNRPTTSLNTIVKMVAKLHELGEYDPSLDQIIVPQNVGALGQESLNQKLAPIFNPNNKRRVIRASYETRFLAIGDKVMFTKNDYGLGILNGMVGYIKNISLNTAYQDYALIKASEENGGQPKDFVVDHHSMEMAELAFNDINKMQEVAEDNPSLTAEQEASHIVVVEYTPLGSEQPAEIALSKVGQIRGLLLAYAITCHKAQGSEYRKVIVVAHSANSMMLSREWLYTAVTRARENLLLIYNEYQGRGLSTALRRQVVKGATIEEKAKNFSLAESTKESSKLNQSLIPLGMFTPEELASQGTSEGAIIDKSIDELSSLEEAAQ